MTPQDAVQALAAEFVDGSSLGPGGLRVQGDAFPPLAPLPAMTERWYRWLCRPLSSDPDAFPASWIGRGMIVVQCFSPRGLGRSENDVMAAAAWDVYRGRDDIGPGIRVVRARFDTQGEQEGFLQQTVRIDWEVDQPS